MIAEISKEGSLDIRHTLRRPTIQRLFKKEFVLTEEEITDVEQQIVSKCHELIQKQEASSIFGMKRSSLLAERSGSILRAADALRANEAR